MGDDSDLLIAAAATAALFTWVSTRRRQPHERRRWSALLATLRAALLRTWRETPGYVLVSAIREAFFRNKR